MASWNPTRHEWDSILPDTNPFPNEKTRLKLSSRIIIGNPKKSTKTALGSMPFWTQKFFGCPRFSVGKEWYIRGLSLIDNDQMLLGSSNTCVSHCHAWEAKESLEKGHQSLATKATSQTIMTLTDKQLSTSETMFSQSSCSSCRDLLTFKVLCRILKRIMMMITTSSGRP